MDTTNNMETAKRYVALEINIPYDWDDYDLWANVLYDTEEKKVIVSKFGHGTPCPYAKDTCTDLSLVDRESFNKSIADMVGRYARVSELERLYAPCSVTMGRKLKGDGFLVIGYRTEIDSWKSARSYRGDVYNTIAEVYDAKSNTIRNINPSYIKLNEGYMENLFLKALSATDKSLQNIAHLIAYKISLYHGDSEYLASGVTRIIQDYLNKQEPISLNGAVNIDDEAKEAKRKAKQEERLKRNKESIIAWAKSKLPKDATQEEIDSLVQKVIDKHYS